MVRVVYLYNQCHLTHILGMMSAAASLGLSLLWDTDVGLSHVDKYTYSAEEHIKVSLLARNQIYPCLI
jgi:26S proteasome regulatory subunit N1